MAVTINYLAVFVAAIINMVIGGLWYSPLLFGNKWLEIMQFDKKKMKEMKQKAKTGYAIAIIPALIMGYVLAHFIDYVGAITVLDGMQVGFWLWFGFVATVQAGQILWEGKPFSLYLINSMYYLVVLLVTGAMFAVWV